MLEQHRTLREGLTAGVLGATAVAVWFLILDTIAGRPFATPSMLGASLATLFGAPGTGPASMLHALPLRGVHRRRPDRRRGDQ